MKTKISRGLVALLFVGLLLLGCKETASKETPEKETTEVEVQETETEQMPSFDPALDPLVVGKEFSKVLSDTLNVQLYEVTMQPGDSIGLHQHLDHAVYILEGGSMIVYINGTDPVAMELDTGTGFVGGPLTDSAKNVGDTTIKLLLTEIHRPREN